MVPPPAASGAVGAGRCCGHRSVCAGNSVSGCLRPAIRMLLHPTARGPQEEEDIEGRGDLDGCEET